MFKELNRLSTFSKWSSSIRISPIQLAKFGFYYSNVSDETVCFSCNVHIHNWTDNDNPLDKHRLVSPGCGFLSGRDNSNVPMDSSFSTISRKTTNRYTIAFGPMSEVLEDALNRTKVKGLLIGNRGHTIDRTYPDFDRLRLESERLDTFDDWPCTAHATPEALAREGFFYTGVDDRVQCVFCQGILKQWEPTDSPLEEHLKYFPDCHFAMQRSVLRNVPAIKNSAGIISTPTHPSEVASATVARKTLSRPSMVPQLVRRDTDVRMNSLPVRAVLDLNYPYDMVKQLIEDKVSQTGTDFPNAESLLEALFNLNVNDETTRISAAAASTITFPSPASATDPSASWNEAANSVDSMSLSGSDVDQDSQGAGLASEPTALCVSRDSGVFLSTSSTHVSSSEASIMPVVTEELFHSTVPETLVSNQTSTSAYNTAPSLTTELPVPSVAAITTMPEIDRSTHFRVKAKKKKVPTATLR